MEELLDDIATQADAAAESIPNWILAPLILLVALTAALLLHEILYRVLNRLVGSREGFWRTLLQTATRPMRIIVVVVALALGVQIAPLTGRQADVFHHSS